MAYNVLLQPRPFSRELLRQRAIRSRLVCSVLGFSCGEL